MKIFQNKKIWQKIVIVVLIVLLFQFAASKPVHAIEGDTLLEPVTNLFANLGDGIMNIMQKTVMGVDSSGAWIEKDDTSFWIKIAVIAGAIIAATVAVVSIVATAGVSLAVIATAVGAVLKIGLVATVVYFVSSTVFFGDHGFYLPEYELTPQAIFQNEIYSFDVNFFNPKKSKIKEETHEEYVSVELQQGTKSDDMILGSDPGMGVTYYLDSKQFDEFCKTYGYDSTKAQYGAASGDEGAPVNVSGYTWSYNGKKYKMYKLIANPTDSSDHSGWVALAEKTTVVDSEKKEVSSAKTLQPIVASWYKTFRNLALVALLSVLVYVGIRIILSSTANDKAKYKQMLGDWVVALCLIFLMHYIMSFAVNINETIIKAISSINISSAEDKEKAIEKAAKQLEANTGNGNKKNEDIKGKGTGVELFIIDDEEAVKRAYETLVGDDDDDNHYEKKDSTFYDRFVWKDGKNEDEDDPSILIWPANDYMTQARIKGQEREGKDTNKKDGLDKKEEVNESQSAVTRAGYNIIYVVLVIYTIIFCFTYLKRVIYMAFLTIIAPLVAITYPIDKINDGKAQAFDLWLKEYIFNLLIQPMHLILYIVLVGSAMEFAAKNIFYVVIALGFLMPAEKLLRRFFGFEKAQTPGMFAGPAGTALMMSGLNKLMHRKPPKGQLGSGGNRDNGDSEDETSEKPPWKDRSFDATENLIGTGGNVENSGDINNENESKLSNKIPYHSNLTSKQIDDLKAQGIEPGDPEYRTALFNYGINPDRNPTQNRKDPSVMNVSSTNKSLAQPKRGRSKRRAIRRATRNYFKGPNGIGRRMINKHKANGGFVKRGIRMAGGVVAGGTLAAAGGIIGIASGDPSKAAQYMAAGAAGGYTLGKGAVNSAADTLKVEGTFEEAKKGYYGDEYSEHQQGKYKKDFIKNEENLKKIEDKLHVERKEAKKIMEDNVQYYLDKEIYDMDDIIATYNLEKEVGRDQAIATAQYANQVMNGEDPTYMTEKRKKEYKDTFIPKFTNNGTRSKEAAEADVNKVFDLVSRFHKFKK